MVNHLLEIQFAIRAHHLLMMAMTRSHVLLLSLMMMARTLIELLMKSRCWRYRVQRSYAMMTTIW